METRRQLLKAGFGLGLFNVVSFGHGANTKKGAPSVPPAPKYVREQTYQALNNFRDVVRSRTLDLLDRRFIFSVNYIRNLSGVTDEVPSDLSDYVVSTIAHMGEQFGTFHEFAHPPIPGVFPTVQQEASLPTPDFRISGSLEQVSEVSKQNRKGSLSPTGGGGHTQWDATASVNGTLTSKTLTVTFNLEGANRVSVPGANATYRMEVNKTEKETDVSIFVAGSGISLSSSKATVTQSLDDAIFDVTACSVIRLLGHALLVPYYLSSPLFEVDDELDERVRSKLSQFTSANLLRNIKLSLISDGCPMDMTNIMAVTDHDRAVIDLELYHRRSLPLPPNRTGYEYTDLAFDLWKGIRSAEAAKRVKGYIGDFVRNQAEIKRQAELNRQEEARRQEAIKRQEEITRQEAAARQAATSKQQQHPQNSSKTKVLSIPKSSAKRNGRHHQAPQHHHHTTSTN